MPHWTIDAMSNLENNEFSKEKPAQYYENDGNGSIWGSRKDLEIASNLGLNITVVAGISFCSNNCLG